MNWPLGAKTNSKTELPNAAAPTQLVPQASWLLRRLTPVDTDGRRATYFKKYKKRKHSLQAAARRAGETDLLSVLLHFETCFDLETSALRRIFHFFKKSRSR